MTALKVLLVIFLFLFLLGRIRVGGDGEYSTEGLIVRLRVGTVPIQVFPLKKAKREKKPAKKKKKVIKAAEDELMEKPQKPERPKKGGSLDLVKAALPLVGEAAGELRERICIDMLHMDLLFGGRDAAQTAILFGMSNAFIAVLLSVFQQNFEVKEHRVHTAVDFNETSTTLYLHAAFSARIGQLIGFALQFGWKFFVRYQNVKKTHTMVKEAI